MPHFANQAVPVVGLDLSLRASGICIIPTKWVPGKWNNIKVSHLGYSLKETATEAEQLDRLLFITGLIPKIPKGSKVFVEQYAYSRGAESSASRLRELGGVIKVELHRLGMTPTPVVASAARKLAVGKLHPKGAKLKAHEILREKWGMPKGWTGDEADAFIVANYGRMTLGLSHLKY